MAVRLGASLFLGGAAITLVCLLLPHPPQLEVRGFLLLAGAQLLIAAVLYGLPSDRAAVAQPVVVMAGGVVVVSAAVHLNGERLGGPVVANEFFYVWPTLYAGYFFRARQLAVALLLTSGAHAAVLATVGVALEQGVTRWVITASVTWGVAIAAFSLRRHVDALVARLREATVTDLLTSVLNRRGFEEAFAVELQRVHRTGEPLTLAIGDVDAFKALNDRFGHAAGDRALRDIAAALRDASRAVDVVARIGGEEFAVLMPGASAADGYEAAERLRRAVSQVRDPAARPLTISFGLVACQPGRPVDADHLLRDADTAMYAAKQQGRDRTVCAAPAAPA